MAVTTASVHYSKVKASNSFLSEKNVT